MTQYTPKWKGPLFLLIAFTVVGATVFYLEDIRKPKVEEAEAESNSLMRIKDASVQRFTLTASDREFSFNCLRKDGQGCKPGGTDKWALTAPLKSNADVGNVNALLRSLKNTSASKTIDLSKKTDEKRGQILTNYGLDTESLNKTGKDRIKKIELKTADEKEFVTYFGNEHPFGDGIFTIRSEGGNIDRNTVLIVPKRFETNFKKTLSYWRDRTILTLTERDIDKLSIKSSKGKLNLKRNKGGWLVSKSEKSPKYSADNDIVNSLVRAITLMKAKEFTFENKNDSKAKKALSGTKTVVTINITQKENPPVSPGDQKTDKKKEQKPEKIRITLHEKKVKSNTVLYLKASNLDPVFEMNYTFKRRFEKNLNDLRLRRFITSTERFAAKRIEFSGKPIGDKPLIFMKKESDWKSDEKNVDFDKKKIRTFLDKVSGKKIKDFLTGKNIPPGEKDGLRILISDDLTEETIKKQKKFVFWKEKNDLFARDLLSDRKEAFKVDRKLKDSLPWKRDYFYKKKKAPPKKGEKT